MLLNPEGIDAGTVSRFAPTPRRFLVVGEHVVEVDTLRVATTPDASRLTPKSMAVLLHLVDNAGRTSSRDALLDEVWKGTCPTPDVLTQAVADLRRVLGDDAQAPRYIETLPRLGYRLVASARFVDALPRKSAPANDEVSADETAPSRDTRRRPRAFPAAPVVGALLVVVVAALAYLRPSASTMAPPRWQATSPHAITSDPGPESYPRISPDGTRLAYSIGNAQLHDARIVQRSLASSRATRLTEATRGDELFPVWSPDGAMLAFSRYAEGQCGLFVAPALGGAERRVAACSGEALNYIGWSPDAKHLLTTAALAADRADAAIALLPVDGGAVERLAYEHAPTDIDLDARYSPDGRKIAFRRGANPYSDLFVMEATGGAVRRLTHLGSRIRGYDWTRDGSALVFSSGHRGEQALYTVSIDDGRIDALDVQPAEFPSAARHADAVVYEIPRLRTQLADVAFDGDVDHGRDVVASTGNDGAPAFSPVDDRIAFVSDRGGAQQLWLHDPVAGETVAVTDAAEPTLRFPAWRADGARLLVVARGADSGRLVEIDLATRTRRVLTAAGDDVQFGVYAGTPDRFVAVVGDRELIEFGRRDGRIVDRRVLARGVARIDRDPATGAVYFTRVAETRLFRIDPQTGIESVVARAITSVARDGWRVFDGQVFRLTSTVSGFVELRRYDPADGSEQRVGAISGWPADLEFSIARDRRHAVIVRTAALDADVGVLTLRRNGAGSG